MKKLLLLLLCVGMLTSCTKNEQPNPTPAPTETASPGEAAGTIQDYFPMKANTVYEYEGNGSSGANQTYYVTYINGDKIQRRISNPVGVATEVLQYADGELKLLYGDAQYYFYEDITQATPNLNMVLLKEPLVLGGKWTVDENSQCEITNVSVEVETPYGRFDALEVTTTYSNDATTKDYYAKGIGLVKILHPSQEAEKISLLKSVSEESGLQVPVVFYDADVVANEQKINFHDITIQTGVNPMEALVEIMKKTTSEDYVSLLTPDTELLSVTLDRTTSTITVDMSDEFIKDSNNGDGIQTLILQCITNTLGNFYAVDKVVITVEGKPFKSGSIEMQEGEYFTVEAYEAPTPEVTELDVTELEAIEGEE